MKKQMRVKNESAFHFFSENLIGFKQNERHHPNDMDNLYYYMKDEIFIRKEIEAGVGSIIIFELNDVSRMSNKVLKNIYTYSVEEYDDVSVRLILICFDITVI